MTDKKRHFFIDLVKGVSVFLMLWGHCIQYCVANTDIDFFENVVFKTIYSFHMPLFMLISGYLFFFSFLKRDMNALIVHRVQSLVQPIVFCTFFMFLTTDVLFGILEGDYQVIISGRWINSLSSLWFLWSVLVCSLAVTLVCKKTDKSGTQLFLLGLFIAVIALFPNLTMNIYMYPYFLIGFFFAKYKERIPVWLDKLKYASIVIFPVMMCFFEKKHYIYTTGLFCHGYPLTEKILINIYRWGIGIAGSVFVLTVLQLLYEKMIVHIKKPVISTGLSRLGKKSLQIYTLSVPLLSVWLSKFFPKILNRLNIENIFVRNMVVYNFGFTLGLAIVYSVALYYFIKLLEKLKLSNVMFGR